MPTLAAVYKELRAAKKNINKRFQILSSQIQNEKWTANLDERQGNFNKWIDEAMELVKKANKKQHEDSAVGQRYFDLGRTVLVCAKLAKRDLSTVIEDYNGVEPDKEVIMDLWKRVDQLFASMESTLKDDRSISPQLNG
jgi:formate-dependent nitrite reductase cytochrome c552 subunit